jgi:CheY-like chemotaxis protein
MDNLGAAVGVDIDMANDLQHKRILVIDDDPDMRVLLDEMLTILGATTVVAEDGQDALQILLHRSGDFDLILSDLDMPLISGLELANKVDALWPGLPVVLLTGTATSNEEIHTAAPSLREILRKPLTIAAISSALLAALP